MMEIERKFLVNDPPADVKAESGRPILQGYLMVEDGSEIRIRRFGRKYFLTSKNGSGLKREETEVSIDQNRFEMLWPASKGMQLEKTRYTLRIGSGLQAELDLYQGLLTGLQLVEVEFPDVDTAMRFDPPIWFGPEVTDDIQFSNSRLAGYNSETIPPDLQNVLGETKHSVGAIPVMQFNGCNHLVIISTRNNMRWIFPKGNPKTGMPDEKVAQKEALEEAGVEGELFGSTTQVHYWKGYSHYRIVFYPMLVSTLHTRWDEKPERQRRICSIEEAEDILHDAGFVLAMKHALNELQTHA
jgi:CYTH domain-containing protein/8-oxo-dGTP pyrophosphatase MutT (NUDIX family)